MAVVVVIGAVYYFAVQQNKPFTPSIPPDEDLSNIVPATS